MKKIISLFIIFTIIMSFSVPCVFAEDAAVSHSCEFELIEALGIDEGITKADDQPISRAEFTAMAVRALNMGGIGAYDGSFTDVAADSPFVSEIYTAKNLRMTNGTSEGVFSPDEPVTSNVALKMLLTAMGYETIAQARGGYPVGYQLLESRLGLLNGISGADLLTVCDAKIIVTNALKSDMAVFSGIEGEQLITEMTSGRTLLSERFDFEKVTGIATTAGYITYSDEVTDNDSLTVAGRDFRSRVNASPYFGMEVTAYSKDGEVWAIEKTDSNKVVILDAKDIVDFSNNILTFYDGNKDKQLRTDVGLSFIKNGRLIIHSDDSFKFADGKLTLIDNDGDNTYDVAVAECIEYFVVSGTNEISNTVYDQNSTIGTICFENNGVYDVCILFDADGNEIQVGDLDANAVLQVLHSDDGKICVAYEGNSKTLKGKVDEITENGYIVSGNEYIPNEYFKARGIVINAGEEYSFLLAPDGTITATLGDGTNGIVYGYLVDAKRETGLESKFLLKILTASNNIEVMALADKVTLNGERGVLMTDAMKIDSLFINGEYPAYQLVRYRTNKDGMINLIDTSDAPLDQTWDISNPVSTDNSLTQYLEKTSVNFRGGSAFGAPYFSFTGGIIFAVPKDLQTKPNAHYSDNLFVTMSSSSLSNNVNYVSDIYDLDSYYYPKAIVVYTELDNSAATVRDEQNSHLVYKISDVADADGQLTKSIKTFSRGRYYSYLVATDKLTALASSMPSVGDIVRFELDRNNCIAGIKIDAKYNSTNKKAHVEYTTGGVNGYISYISGTVKTIGNGQVTLRVLGDDFAPGSTINGYAPVPLSNTRYAVFNTTTGEVTTGVITDVMGSNMVGLTNASKVVCRISYYAVTDMFIYVQ